MSKLLTYLKRSFILEIKRTIAYPVTFWTVSFVIPMFSVVQIAFLETIFSQTNNFAGYTKYEGYILFGTYGVVQGLGHFFLNNRLAELKDLIRGDSQESFDMILLKPLDSQLLATMGRFSFGDIPPLFIATLLVIYGFIHEPQLFSLFNFLGYLYLIVLGTIIYYVTLLFASTFLFWFPELQVTQPIWDATLSYGKYPTNLYHGTMGVIFNLVIPITLMSGIPVGLLLGDIPNYMIIFYTFVVFLLVIFTRWFWNIAIKKYSSFSS